MIIAIVAGLALSTEADMENLEHLKKTLEHYRQQRQQKLDEVRAIELMIRQLEIDLGESPTVEALAVEEGSANQSRAVGLRSIGPIRPDEFFGMSQNDAARAYLRKVGRAISMDELVAALQKGGATLGGADPKKTLYVSMSRNPKKEFVWPSKDHIGLAEFYKKS
jgi:hypothetical protein